MKFKNLLLLSFAALSLGGPAAIAQSRGNWCATDQHYLDLQKQFPAEHRQRMAYEAQIQKLINDPGSVEMRKSGPLKVIPVVIHVVTADGTGGISKAQILDGIRILNEDLRRLNPDASTTRPQFQGVAADLEVEFRLAKIDPNGNCTEGITRDASVLTNSAIPRNDIKTAVPAWDPNRYFNIWIVNSIDIPVGNSFVAGYAQFPGTGPLNTYGFVCRQDFWGSIGTARGNGRTATHELGHCLDLYHTFQGGCGSNCETSGDFVCDTPPASNPTYGCITSTDNCSNDAVGGSVNNPNPYTANGLNQIENYMSYDDGCQNMFTIGQRNRTTAAFATYPFLQGLIANSNLISTGTNDGYVAQLCKPIADFTVSPQRVCAGSTFNFSNASYNADATPTTTYSWNFPGGTPATATTANASTIYNTPGTYNVTLTVTNASGVSNITKQVKVGTVTNGEVAPLAFGFENITFPTNSADPFKNWEIIANSPTTWTSTTDAAIEGTRSIKIAHNNIPYLRSNFLISPNINRANLSNGSLKFKVAYKQRNNGSTIYNDELKVSFSPDCGATWYQRYTKKGANLSTSPGAVAYTFVPTASEWRQETIPLAGFPNSSTLLIRFESVSENGNVLYLDDFRIDGTVTGVDEVVASNSISVFPNPMTNETAVNFELLKPEVVSVTVTDVVGKVVYTKAAETLTAGAQQISLRNPALKAGLYLVQVLVGEKSYTAKLVVQ